jgi:hypothetical protein
MPSRTPCQSPGTPLKPCQSTCSVYGSRMPCRMPSRHWLPSASQSSAAIAALRAAAACGQAARWARGLRLDRAGRGRERGATARPGGGAQVRQQRGLACEKRRLAASSPVRAAKRAMFSSIWNSQAFRSEGTICATHRAGGGDALATRGWHCVQPSARPRTGHGSGGVRMPGKRAPPALGPPKRKPPPPTHPPASCGWSRCSCRPRTSDC